MAEQRAIFNKHLFAGTSVFDLNERDRRWSNIRRELEKKGLDGLLVVSDGQLERRGSFRYVSDSHMTLRYGYVIFPLKGDPVGVYGRGGWIEDRRMLSFRGGWIMESEPYASFIADIVKEMNIEKGNIGIEGDFLPVPVYQGLVKELPEATFSPSNIVHELKMVKSNAEIKAIERGVEMVDKVYEACIKYARPGLTWNDITSEVCKLLYQWGTEDIGGYPLSRSTNVIKNGDSYNLYPEPQVSGGYWMQFGRFISFGEPEKELQAAWELDIKAQEYGAEKLRPGNTGGDLMRAINEALKGSKYTGATRGSGHGVGLDIIERPYIALDDETVFKPGMIVAIHPVLTPHPEIFEACADMFVVTENAPRKLSRITPEIKII
jgi:Xaa-Pro aminopeptidase